MRLIQALAEIRKRSYTPDFFSLKHNLRPLSTSRKRAPLRTRAGSVVPQKNRGKTSFSNGKDGGEGGGGSVNENLNLGFSQTLTGFAGCDDLRHGSRFDSVSIGKQIINALLVGDREKASTLLGNESLRANDFLDIFRYCAKLPDPLLALQSWRIMAEKDIIPDKVCYGLAMQALCKGGNLDEAFSLLKSPGEGCTSYTSLAAYNTFLEASLEKHSAVHINQCLELMDQRMVGKNEATYAQLLKIAVWLENLSAVNQIWEDYIKHFSPSIMSLQKFVAAFARLGDLSSAFEKLRQMVGLAIQANIFVNNITGYRCAGSLRLDIPVPVIGPLDVGKFNQKDTSEASSLLGNSEFESSAAGELAKFLEKPIRMLLRWSFRDVINVCADTQNFGLAESLMLQMRSLGLQPTRYVYHAFIKAVIHEKGIGEALELLKEMQQKDIKPLNSTLAAISMACSNFLELDLAEALLDQISSSNSPYPYNQFLAACDKMDRPDRAVRMFNKMRQLKIQPNVRTYELLFSLFGNVNAPYEPGNMLSRADSMKRVNAIEMDMAKNGVLHNHWSLMYLLKALAAEGMPTEFMQYLRIAEDPFQRIKRNFEGTLVYSTIMHSLVEAKNSDLTVELFKNMRANGFQPDSETYCIMIDCCSLIRCYKSACAVVSLMLRDGYLLHHVAYCVLIKVALKCGDLDEALRLLDLMASDKIQPNVLVYNTILKKARSKGRLDIVEFLVEQMHRDSIKPDPDTCFLVFSAYLKQNFHSTALEALQVLSLRMICQEENFSPEKVESYVGLALAEDSDAEMQILELLAGSEDVAFALLNLRWCSVMGCPIPWPPNQSIWARRTMTAYDLGT